MLRSFSAHSCRGLPSTKQGNINAPHLPTSSSTTYTVIMPKYKLVYFDIRGRAEITRFLFAAAGIEYDDCRVTEDEFKVMKDDVSKAPLGQLPVLFVDDHPPIPQSHVIERYLARKFGMFGKNEEEAVRIDVVCESVVDIIDLLQTFYDEKDEAKKKEIGEEFVNKGCVPYLTAMCNVLKKNAGGKGYFVGDKMSGADIAIFNMTEVIIMLFPGLLEKYPELKEFNTRMRAEPKIAEWLAKRPASVV